MPVVKKLRPTVVVAAGASLLGTTLLLVSMVAIQWVTVRGDTSSLAGGQVYSSTFGLFSVCDDIHRGSSSCVGIDTGLVAGMMKLRAVNNYIDRGGCTDRTQAAASSGFLLPAQLCIVFSFVFASCGAVVMWLTFLRRPEDVAVLSIQARWKRRVGWNPLVACVLLWIAVLLCLGGVATYVYLFDTWVGCGERFCDVCRYAQDCVCGFGASLVLASMAMVLLFLGGLLAFVRWFRLIGGSSTECPCSE